MTSYLKFGILLIIKGFTTNTSVQFKCSTLLQLSMSPNAHVPGANGLDWPDKILAQIPDRRNHGKFWEDGLNTGVRVLGMQTPSSLFQKK